jgi:hypothetical protein
MLESIKRWLSGAPSPSDFEAIAQWATGRGHEFKRSRDSEGFVIEAARAIPPWRLEWGPSQRNYIAGAELRLRAETGSGSDVQLLVLSRALMELLERQVFEEYTDQLQTRVDTATPEEMRWLVLYPKVPAAELKDLRGEFGGVASVPQLLPQWLDGPLADKLAQARASWLGTDDPLVLIVQRGRLTMRTALARPDPAQLASLLGLFEVALREARRVAVQWRAESAAGTESTQPSLWGGREGPPTQT